MKIIALSDTHGHHLTVNVPEGDVLVFAGDLMTTGYRHSDLKSFAKWWNDQPHRFKILVSGNHDRMLQSDEKYCLDKLLNTIYLKDSGCIIEGLKFWGSPYTPYFCDWAFDYQPGNGHMHWDKIPEGLDVLITHGPQLGILDSMGALYDNGKLSEIHVGCNELAKAVDKVKPRVHIFGHIHNGYGIQETPNTNFHNVAICNEAYNPVNKPHQIYIEEL